MARLRWESTCLEKTGYEAEIWEVGNHILVVPKSACGESKEIFWGLLDHSLPGVPPDQCIREKHAWKSRMGRLSLCQARFWVWSAQSSWGLRNILMYGESHSLSLHPASAPAFMCSHVTLPRQKAHAGKPLLSPFWEWHWGDGGD